MDRMGYGRSRADGQSSFRQGKAADFPVERRAGYVPPGAVMVVSDAVATRLQNRDAGTYARGGLTRAAGPFAGSGGTPRLFTLG